MTGNSSLFRYIKLANPDTNTFSVFILKYDYLAHPCALERGFISVSEHSVECVYMGPTGKRDSF
jgi:hypothetical protein